MFQNSDDGEKDVAQKNSFEDPVSDKDEEKKMQMSYDSGLNSIENESILDEDEETWLQAQNHHLEKQKIEDNLGK